MSGRGVIRNRCPECRMQETLCICALTPQLTSTTKLHLILHHIESHKTTNTGSLAARCLAGSEVSVVGRPGERARVDVRPPAVVLFPAEDARPLEDFVGAEGLTLVVPDGTWRQASRARYRTPGVAELPCVALRDLPPSRYRLRVERRPGGTSTLEAIARAYEVLGEPEVAASLLEIFDVMVERTLYSRGDLSSDQVRGGVPEAARRLMGHA